jgi:hypothetical protein
MTWASKANNQHVPTSDVQDAISNGNLELGDGAISGPASNRLWTRTDYAEWINHSTSSLVASGIAPGQHMTKAQMETHAAFLPDAPDLEVTDFGNGFVELSWLDVLESLWFTLYRNTTGGPPTSGDILEAQLTIGDSPYLDSGLTNGVTYYYWMTTTSPGGTSLLSDRVDETPVAPATTPQSFTGFGNEDDPSAGQYTAYLTWSNATRSEQKTLEIWNRSGATWQSVNTSIAESATSFHHTMNSTLYTQVVDINGEVDYRIRFNSEADWADTTVVFVI